jgi:hypothetical protein
MPGLIGHHCLHLGGNRLGFLDVVPPATATSSSVVRRCPSQRARTLRTSLTAATCLAACLISAITSGSTPSSRRVNTALVDCQTIPKIASVMIKTDDWIGKPVAEPDAKVKLKLEIEAEAPAGLSQADIGVVRDNARQSDLIRLNVLGP